MGQVIHHLVLPGYGPARIRFRTRHGAFRRVILHRESILFLACYSTRISSIFLFFCEDPRSSWITVHVPSFLLGLLCLHVVGSFPRTRAKQRQVESEGHLYFSIASREHACFSLDLGLYLEDYLGALPRRHMAKLSLVTVCTGILLKHHFLRSTVIPKTWE